MTTIKYAGKTITVNDDGFLADLDAWDEDTARTLAWREGIKKLSAEQMEIIKFMRNYYKKFDAFPILNQVIFTNPESVLMNNL